MSWGELQKAGWLLAVVAPGLGAALLPPDNLLTGVLIGFHTVPFLLVGILARRVSRSRRNRDGLIGATLTAAVLSAAIWAWAAWDQHTGWQGGADIGLGLALLAYPLVVGPLMAFGFLLGSQRTTADGARPADEGRRTRSGDS
jgi:peptidoglycan/LPS O-acetylase OafA/YrhL